MSSIWTVRRSVTDRKVSGLAGGIAEVWDVDPVLVRVAFGILALSGGIGIVLYLAGWLMIPSEDRQTSVLDEAIPQTRGWSREVRIGIVIVACLIGAATLSSVVPFGFAAAVVMAAVWYFGYYRNRPQRPDGPAQQPEPMRFAEFPGEPTPFTEAARAWQQRIVEYETTLREQQTADAWARHEASRRSPGPQYLYRTGSSPEGWAAPDWTGPQPTGPAPTPPASFDPARAAFLAHPDPVGLYSEPAPDDSAVRLAAERRALRKRSARRLGLASLIVLGLTMSGLGLASSLGATIPVATWLSAALLVIGLTLLAGTRFGRPPGMAFVAVVLSLVTAFSVVADRTPAWSGEQFGRQTVSYTDPATMHSADHLSAGQLTVDLRGLELTSDRQYTASVDTGRLTVLLPPDIPTAVDYRVGDGMINIPDQATRWGSNLTGSVSPPGPPAATPTLRLDLRVRQGQLEVRR